MVDDRGFVHCEVRRGMYGLPQAGLLAQQQLIKRLNKAGYHQSVTTPGFWKHEWRPISFTLVVDDFGVKYVGKQNADHLVSVLQEHYTIDIDWEGTRYIGLTLDWDYSHHKVIHARVHREGITAVRTRATKQATTPTAPECR